MPRPGPRPYECVRRAWHSDRHQSMRGSIIQQIFKVVYEHHSSVTKKNKEWQEKLPVVVLKAEEIMYSKANSEQEYMDLGTLWDRVNDAIDIIIRKDETAETEGVLPPCVEAALNLGCVPVRASRSQRHSNPKNYLCPRTHEPSSSSAPKVSSVVPRRTDHNPSIWSPGSRNKPNLHNVPLVSGSNSHNHITQPINSVGSVYPLYYGTNFVNKMRPPQNHSDIIVGTPVYAPSEIISSRLVCPTEKPNLECDLSLRLGLVADTDSFHRAKGRLGSDVLSTSYRGNELCLFTVESDNDPSGSHLPGYNLEGEDQSERISSRKRKNVGN